MDRYAFLQLAQENSIEVNERLLVPGILAILAGILILVVPRALNYIIAIYLILQGLALIFGIGF
ncbi:MAG: DUF3096 domain-containing protein [Actinobacteria bacterium]|nr:DUF3096 domain-containing protein [Actinomycetota bacterium]